MKHFPTFPQRVLRWGLRKLPRLESAATERIAVIRKLQREYLLHTPGAAMIANQLPELVAMNDDAGRASVDRRHDDPDELSLAIDSTLRVI